MAPPIPSIPPSRPTSWPSAAPASRSTPMAPTTARPAGAMTPIPLGTSIGSGGGVSLYEPEPAYQQGVQSTGNRTTPDVSLVADPATGAWIADTYNSLCGRPVRGRGRHQSVGPCLGRPDRPGQPGTSSRGRGDPEQLQPDRYPAGPLHPAPERLQHDHQRHQRLQRATAGYNLVTGLGTPVANLLVPDLIAYQGPGDHPRPPEHVARCRMATFTSGARSHGGGTTTAFDAFNVLTASRAAASSGALILDASLAMRRASSLVNLTPAVAVYDDLCPPHSGLRSRCRSAPLRFTDRPSRRAAISNSTSTLGTSAPSVGVTNSSFSTGLAPQWSVPSHRGWR